MIKVIGFDLGGVYLSDCWGAATKDSIHKKFHITRKNLSAYDMQITEGLISEGEFLRKIGAKDEKTIKKLKMHIRAGNKVIFPEIQRLIRKLRKHYKVALMNNEGKEWNDYRIKKFRLAKLFDEILTSCMLKDSKPKKSYFQKVLSKLNIKPGELLFIDDKIENAKAARRLGVASIVFRNPIQLNQELSKLGIGYN